MLSLFPCESGLSFPDFRSILVTGPYHASAPVHLLLSRATLFPGTRAVLITPSQGVIAAALQEHNDAWLSTHSGQGRTLELSWCTTVYYPPTPAHFAFLLSMLSTDVDKTPSETVLEGQPSLVVLVELSAYFLGDVQVNPDRHSWTLSSYMSLIARVWAFVGGLGKDSPVSVALFDSGLDRLKLPIVKNPSAESKRPSRDENAIFFVQKYFDTMAVFEKDDQLALDSSQDEENEVFGSEKQNCALLYSLAGTNPEPTETLRWCERRVSGRGVLFVKRKVVE